MPPHSSGLEAGKSGFPSQAQSGSSGIKFCGRLYGDDGPAQSGRLFALALHEAGVPVQWEPVAENGERRRGDELAALVQQLNSRSTAYSVKILHLPPEEFGKFREPGCVNIGYAGCEADRISATWVEACNQMDGILVPSTWCRRVFEMSGVRVPVRAALPGIDAEQFASRSSEDGLRWLPYRLHRLGATKARSRRKTLKNWLKHRWRQWFNPPPNRLNLRTAFKFYSVFRWSERSNPRGLLEAYLSEFHRDHDVCLILRSEGRDFGRAQRRWIDEQIEAVCQSMRLPGYPPVLVVAGRLTPRELCRLHDAGDCFVLPHRGEAFGTAHLEAMAAGKPVITTGFSGTGDLTREENSLLLPYQLTPVFNMPDSPWLSGDMLWAEPDLGALRGCMRRVFENRSWAEAIGRRAQDCVKVEFNWTSRAQAMLSAIYEISAARQGSGVGETLLRRLPGHRSLAGADRCRT